MSPSVCFASLLLGCTLLPSPAIAEHEGTAAWMQGIDKTRKEIVSKIRNERIEHKWLEDGKTFFARIKKVEKSNQWFAYDLSSTYQVVNALIKADKDFEYYMVPNGGHGIGEKPHLRRKRIEFFQKHLQSAK